MAMKTKDIRFEGSNGIYKVFVRSGRAYFYERTIATDRGQTNRAAKLAALEESREQDTDTDDAS